MANIIAVFGATGAQGGGVVTELLKDKGWSVRALTRNVNSPRARALRSQGAEVAFADLEDPSTLPKAIEGSHAVFGVTDYWQYVANHGNVEAGNIETRQGIGLLGALARSPTLQHFIWSTLPGAIATSPNDIQVPHMDSKNRVDKYLEQHYPDLLAKTTFLRVAWYAENLAWHDFFKPQKYNPGGQYIFVQPCAPTTVIPMAGHVRKNTGTFVKAVLSHPEKSLPAKTAVVSLGFALSYPQLLEIWKKVTGKKVTFLSCTKEAFASLYGDAGLELALQYEFMEKMGEKMMDHPDIVEPSDLGITQLVGIEETLKELEGSWD
ncbi:hypothetical protein A1O1_06726 [Capronia coronata CBS 617.96]|uniref:NmrA-like domain-containing protein n=1 Tax=Capronia coronata CBS 617.96 TaxID=1182541 RepID=W9XS95_9EURO|nr:uncharacterized protein A1O1_06726 [Capronia coronata CBS 617.96]EXJ83108.1 hypothetical protein A1O1_06726 [Capronia coronata CBS 617.96]